MHVCIYIYMYICAYRYICIYVYMHIYMYMKYKCIDMYVYVYVKRIDLYIYICIRIDTYICICILNTHGWSVTRLVYIRDVTPKTTRLYTWRVTINVSKWMITHTTSAHYCCNTFLQHNTATHYCNTDFTTCLLRCVSQCNDWCRLLHIRDRDMTYSMSVAWRIYEAWLSRRVKMYPQTEYPWFHIFDLTHSTSVTWRIDVCGVAL